MWKGCGGEAVLVCAQMLEVWGAGESTARRWQQEGCHSLQDVEARSDLTTQQVSRTRAPPPADLSPSAVLLASPMIHRRVSVML